MTAGRDGSRLAWVDVAKSLAIVLVVVYHVSRWFFAFVFEGASHPVADFWRELSILLTPMRIPLFFLMSGVLAHRAVHRSWKELARTRLSDLLWPFAIWSLLISPLWFVHLERTQREGASLVLGGLAFGGTHLWFLSALAVFLVVGKLTWRVPIPALVVAAVLAFFARGAVGWALAYLPAALADNVGRWRAFLFWFLLGCFGRQIVVWVAARPWPFALGGTAVVVAVAMTGTEIPTVYRIPLLAFTGVGALVAWSALASRSLHVARWGRYLAGRTLAIYVGHSFLLELLAVGLLAQRRLIPDINLVSTVAMVVFVPVLTVALVWATTWFYDRCVPGRFSWLYQPPWRTASPVSV